MYTYFFQFAGFCFVSTQKVDRIGAIGVARVDTDETKEYALDHSNISYIIV
jgi:hypothetical protein